MAADILVLGMSIWLGEKSSIATQIVERLYGNSHLLNDAGQYAYYGRVGGCLVTGNEDGVKHCAMNTLYSLQHLGYVIPPQADSGWIGEAGPGPSYLDRGLGRPRERLHESQHHLRRLEHDAPGPDPEGRRRHSGARQPANRMGRRLPLRLPEPGAPGGSAARECCAGGRRLLQRTPMRGWREARKEAAAALDARRRSAHAPACWRGARHAPTRRPAFKAHGSAEQVYVTGLAAKARMKLLDRGGWTVATKRADQQGGLLFRNVKPGKGYRVELAGGGAKSGPLNVFSTRPAPPSTKVYDQSIPSHGYGYLTTRDGTKLAIDVHPPEDVTSVVSGFKPPVYPNGETPTLIEYSGYGYADPAGPQNGIAILANLLGFTVVDVNMRGTGCSGGAYDFFEPLQSLDGYDVIETIARQPWALHHKVGMMGISYGGISQLFTAQTNPPSLAAIAPLSVIDQTQTTLYPGGILNTGFALQWAKERVHDALPASANGGQSWAYARIQDGDKTCKANQALHGEAASLLAKIKANQHYKPRVADPLAPLTFVHKIKAPVYMACQWTDEQTGGHCPDLAEEFTGTRRKWFTFTNGTHADSLDPDTFNRMYDFLELLDVAKQAPIAYSPILQAAAPLIYQEAMGVSA